VSGVQVRVEGSAPLVRADAELLKIVFQNLLINGAHAMAGRGELHVKLQGDGDHSSVAFTDRGPGIPADIRDKIFTPFFTTKIRGTGLGLPTAKRLVEAQGGTIAIECPPAGGTTVIVQLPILPA
jgi:signal transduction histidine kinase